MVEIPGVGVDFCLKFPASDQREGSGNHPLFETGPGDHGQQALDSLCQFVTAGNHTGSGKFDERLST